ncbi:NADP-dependent phosphogluconate dehydrogenase, partial [Macrococcus caseolyticus]
DVPAYTGDKQNFIDALEQALYASKIISYAKGFQLIRAAGNEFGWKFNNAGIGLMWRGGCIIRSVFLADITAAFHEKPDLENLLFYPFFNDAIHKAQKQWREIVALAVQHGVPTPCFTTAISFYDGYRSARLPANLLQAQRDYFGAHTFRVLEEAATDEHPANADIHVNWTGHGGNVSSSTYIA